MANYKKIFLGILIIGTFCVAFNYMLDNFAKIDRADYEECIKTQGMTIEECQTLFLT